MDLIQGLRTAGHTCLNLELDALWRRLQSSSSERARLMQVASAQVAGVIRDQRVDLSASMWSNAIATLAHVVRDVWAVSCFEANDPPHPHLQYWLEAPDWAQAGSVRQMLPSGIFASPRRTPGPRTICRSPATRQGQ